MARKTTIQRGPQGIFVNAGAYYTTPSNGTIFKEGDEVLTTHHGGTTNATVKSMDGSVVENWYTRSFCVEDYKKLKSNLTTKDFEYTLDGILNFSYGTTRGIQAFQKITEQKQLTNNTREFKDFKKRHGGIRKMKPLSEAYKLLQTGDIIEPTFDLDFESVRQTENEIKKMGFVDPFNWIGATYKVLEIHEKYVKLLRTYNRSGGTAHKYIAGDEIIKHLTSDRIKRHNKLESILV